MMGHDARGADRRCTLPTLLALLASAAPMHAGQGGVLKVERLAIYSGEKLKSVPTTGKAKYFKEGDLLHPRNLQVSRTLDVSDEIIAAARSRIWLSDTGKDRDTIALMADRSGALGLRLTHRGLDTLGRLQLYLRVGTAFMANAHAQLSTDLAEFTPRGTRFSVEAGEKASTLYVWEGEVHVRSLSGVEYVAAAGEVIGVDAAGRILPAPELGRRHQDVHRDFLALSALNPPPSPWRPILWGVGLATAAGLGAWYFWPDPPDEPRNTRVDVEMILE